MAVPGNLADGVMALSAIRGDTSGYASISYPKGIWIGGPTSINGDSTWTRHLAVGVTRSNAQGNPTAPSLAIAGPGFWRFRWSLSVGTHTLSVSTMQVTNQSPRPSMIVKKNAAIGLAGDVTTVAPGGTGWVTVGPVSVTVSAAGVVWVELWNNLYAQYDTTYFDHIVVT